MRAVLVVLAVSIAAAVAPAFGADLGAFGGAKTEAAKPGDLKMSLSVAGPTTITAYEPVVLREQIENVSGRSLDVTTSPDYTTRIEIRDASGVLVAQTPLLEIPLDFIVGIHTYKVGQTRTFFLAISAIYTFSKPGKYTISVQEGMTRDNRAGFDELAHGSVALTVLPFSKKALDARLKQLFEPVINGKGGLPPSNADLSSNAILKAMWSVRHDAIIPYLVKTADFGSGWPGLAARALYRIGSPKAKEALKALTDRKDGIGKNARDGLAYDLEVDCGDWHVEKLD